MAYYCFHKIRDNVYHITSKEGTFCQLVLGRDRALLFDTGFGLGDLRGEVSEVTDLPVTVVNSHGHLDHVNGNCQFEGPFFISERDHQLALRHSSPEYRRKNVEDAKHTVTDRMKGTIENILPGPDFDEAAYINAKMPAWEFIEDGDSIDLGGVTLKVVAVPGHTGGSITLWYEAERVLLVGDAFGPFTWLFDSDAGSLGEYTEGLRKVKALGPDVCLTGHGLEPVPYAMLDAYLDAAENADYAKGMPWQPPVPEYCTHTDIRVCARPGYVPFQFEREGYASIVIDPAHLV